MGLGSIELELNIMNSRKTIKYILRVLTVAKHALDLERGTGTLIGILRRLCQKKKKKMLIGRVATSLVDGASNNNRKIRAQHLQMDTLPARKAIQTAP